MSISDIVAIGVLVFAVIGAIVAVLQVRVTSEQLRQSREKIDQAESRVAEQPEKAKPAWDLARATLEAYFNRNLSQVTWIFWLSVTVMFIGFIIVGLGIAQAIQSPNILGPAAIASIAGIITEFIGATFLFIYRSTIQQAIDYSQTLERINSVGMAMQILDTMPDQTQPEDLKSKTKATIVEVLVRQSYDPSKQQRESVKEDGNDKKA
jgi:hypothetical protein